MSNDETTAKQPEWRWWTITFFALFGLTVLAGLISWVVGAWLVAMIVGGIFLFYMSGMALFGAVLSSGKQASDVVRDIERDADALYGPGPDGLGPDGLGPDGRRGAAPSGGQRASAATVEPLVAAERAVARQSYVTYRLTMVVIGFGLLGVALLAGLLFSFWLLAYIGGGLMLLVLVAMIMSAGG